MAVKFEIKDSRGTNNSAKVTTRGQLVVAPLEFDSSYSTTLGTINTGYNLVTPNNSRKFVITSIVASGNLNVGVNGATMYLYEASSATSTTVSKQLYKLIVPRLGNIVINPLNLLTSEAVWLNAKTDDDDIELTITGYYIDT